jgi:hypothetical protein
VPIQGKDVPVRPRALLISRHQRLCLNAES